MQALKRFSLAVLLILSFICLLAILNGYSPRGHFKSTKGPAHLKSQTKKDKQHHSNVNQDQVDQFEILGKQQLFDQDEKANDNSITEPSAPKMIMESFDRTSPPSSKNTHTISNYEDLVIFTIAPSLISSDEMDLVRSLVGVCIIIVFLKRLYISLELSHA